MMRVEIPNQSEQEQFLNRVTRTQLERALMQAAPPTNVATESSKEQTRKTMDLRSLMQERVQMQRLGFGDTVHKLDEEIDEDEFHERKDRLMALRLQRGLNHDDSASGDSDEERHRGEKKKKKKHKHKHDRDHDGERKC